MKSILKSTIIFFVAFALLSCTSKPLIRFKAVYLDMDGTTLDSNHEIRQDTIDALEKYRSCGGKVGIATGRTYNMVEAYLKDIKPNMPLVLFNGGLIVSPDGKDFEILNSLNDDIVSKALAKTHRQGVAAVYIDYPDEVLIDRMNEHVRAFNEMTGLTNYRVCDDINACIAEKKAKSGALPIKVVFEIEPSVAEPLRDELKEIVGDTANSLITSIYSVEVLPLGVDKAITLKKVLKEYGLAIDDVMVFGDSSNDTKMVGEISVGMAMGNCRPSTCKAALFKIGTNDTDAIARTIRRLAMLEGCRE